MGCDIHFFVERYTSVPITSGPRDISEERNNKLENILENSEPVYRWITADTWKLEREIYLNKKSDYWSISYDNEYYGDRNYYLFSVLADVRNYRSNIIPISEPRGIPEDASSAYKHIVDQWDSDGHSHSYFTLTELLNVDWEEYNDGEYNHCGSFLETIERMKKIDPNPDNVRCVFFFDN